jgi:hypothetical protein
MLITHGLNHAHVVLRLTMAWLKNGHSMGDMACYKYIF